MNENLTPQRKYDKGERRFKHVGKLPVPTFKPNYRRPNELDGVCPSGISDELRQNLLKEAIAVPKNDREINYDQYLYVVHGGAIYQVRTSDRGVSYHAFPYHGELRRPLKDRLREMAEDKNCQREFDKWVKEHITIV